MSIVKNILIGIVVNLKLGYYFCKKCENRFIVFAQNYNEYLYNFFSCVLIILWSTMLYNTFVLASASVFFSLFFAKYLRGLYLAISQQIGVRYPLYFMILITLISSGIFYKSKVKVKELLKLAKREIEII